MGTGCKQRLSGETADLVLESYPIFPTRDGGQDVNILYVLWALWRGQV